MANSFKNRSFESEYNSSINKIHVMLKNMSSLNRKVVEEKNMRHKDFVLMGYSSAYIFTHLFDEFINFLRIYMQNRYKHENIRLETKSNVLESAFKKDIIDDVDLKDFVASIRNINTMNSFYYDELIFIHLYRTNITTSSRIGKIVKKINDEVVGEN